MSEETKKSRPPEKAIFVYVPVADHNRLKAAARAERRSLSNWVRCVLLDAAKAKGKP